MTGDDPTPSMPDAMPDADTAPQRHDGIGHAGASAQSHPSTDPARPAPRKRRRHEAPNGLPRWRRLRQTRDFARVERQGARASNDIVAVTVRPGPGRVGFVVSKKVDNRASVRNLVKRRLRDILRTSKYLFLNRNSGALDVIVTARAAAADVGYAALADAVIATLKAAIIKNDAAPSKRGRR
jgi:ribonuclease P protein component